MPLSAAIRASEAQERLRKPLRVGNRERSFRNRASHDSLAWLLLVAGSGSGARSADPLAGATDVWSGAGADDNWSTAANWSLNRPPDPGDDVIMAGTTRLTPVHDLAAGLALRSLHFNDGGFTLSGNSFSAQDILNAVAAVNTIAAPIWVMTATQPIRSNAGGTLVLSGAVGESAPTGGIFKLGAGTVILSAPNTYTGLTEVQEGTLVAASAGALGSTAAGTRVQSGATLELQGGVVINGEALELVNGGALNNVGNNAFGAPVVIASAGTIGSSSGTLTVIGDISGPGNLTKAGLGTVVLINQHTYLGTTTVALGTLVVESDSGLGGSTSGTTVQAGGTLAFQGGVNYASPEALTISGMGVSGGAIQNVSGNNTFAGPVTLADHSTILSSAGTLTLSAPFSLQGFSAIFDGAGSSIVSGVIGGTGTLAKASAGTLTLTAANTMGGNAGGRGDAPRERHAERAGDGLRGRHPGGNRGNDGGRHRGGRDDHSDHGQPHGCLPGLSVGAYVHHR